MQAQGRTHLQNFTHVSHFPLFELLKIGTLSRGRPVLLSYLVARVRKEQQHISTEAHKAELHVLMAPHPIRSC